MNERIKELAEQATVTISYKVCPNTFKEIDDLNGPFVRKEFSKEKFAELIVRECARVYWNIDDGETHGEYVKALKKHFGVE